MNDQPTPNEEFDLPTFWRTLQDLEDGSIQSDTREKVMALLRDSSEARKAYFEYFQQTAIFEMEGAKMNEAGRLPILNVTGSSQRLFKRSLAVAAVITAILAILATLIVIKRPEPGVLQAQVAAETRWTINDINQETGDQKSEVIEGSTVTVLSGTLELIMETGTVLVMQGPATVSFQDLRKPFLKEGWFWVDSSADDEDFAVETKDYLIRDIGTRFGLRASAKDRLEIHLIEGQIELTDKHKDELISKIEPSETGIAIKQGTQPTDIELALDPFPSLPELLSAEANLTTTILSQSPVGYWKFAEVLPGLLQNEMSEQMTTSHGVAVELGQRGLGSEGDFVGISEKNRGIYLTAGGKKSAVLGLDGPDGVSTKEGAVSFWICGDTQRPNSQALWLAGFSTLPTISEPTKTVLHTSLTKDGQVNFSASIGGEEAQLGSRKNILDQKWHHIVASWGTSTIDLFVDGKLVDRHRPSSSLIDKRLTGRFVRFGKPGIDLRAQGMMSFKGWLDELAIWNRPLTHAEVLHQYESARGSSQR